MHFQRDKHVFYHLHMNHMVWLRVGDGSLALENTSNDSVIDHATLPGTSSVWPDFSVFLGHPPYTIQKIVKLPTEAARSESSCNAIFVTTSTDISYIAHQLAQSMFHQLRFSWTDWFVLDTFNDSCRWRFQISHVSVLIIWEDDGWCQLHPTSINQLWMGWIRLLLPTFSATWEWRMCKIVPIDMSELPISANNAEDGVGKCDQDDLALGHGPWVINREWSIDIYWIYAASAAVVWFWFLNIGTSLLTPGLDVSNCLGFLGGP